MANILISTLGKGPYSTAKYKVADSHHEYETPFVVEALNEYLHIDKIFLLGTAQSMWHEVFRYFGKAESDDKSTDIYLELQEKIEHENEGIKILVAMQIDSQWCK